MPCWPRIATEALLVLGIAPVLVIIGLTIWTGAETGNTYLVRGVAASEYACVFSMAALIDRRSRRVAAVRGRDRASDI